MRTLNTSSGVSVTVSGDGQHCKSSPVVVSRRHSTQTMGSTRGIVVLSGWGPARLTVRMVSRVQILRLAMTVSNPKGRMSESELAMRCA